LSLVAYVALAALKLGIGWWGHSSGLVADGFNNTTDAIAGVAVLFGLRISVRPPDQDHRYGHARAESVAAMLVAAMMGLIGVNVFISAVQTALRPATEMPSILVAWVGGGAAVLMFIIAAYNRGTARRTGSQALAAVAHDNQADAYTSLGTVAGVLGSRAGWAWADPLVALLIAVIIVRAAWQIGHEASHTLMDGFDTHNLKQIKERALAVPGVTALRDVRARHLGSGVAVEMTVLVHEDLSVSEAHDICDRIEHELKGFLDISHVHVHVEPH
jgi:cation diffusion facilitator family transporter